MRNVRAPLWRRAFAYAWPVIVSVTDFLWTMVAWISTLIVAHILVATLLLVASRAIRIGWEG